MDVARTVRKMCKKLAEAERIEGENVQEMDECG
jgi:hypothetical protein